MFSESMTFDEVLQELDRNLDAIYLDLRKPPNGAPSVVFHYTDSGGLLGITNSNCLWASNVRFLNDLSEPKYAGTILKRSIETVKMRSKAADHRETKLLLGNFWNMYEQRPARDPEAYVFCFCENGDLLSQWRGYGLGGRGFALGFNTTELIRLLQPGEGQYMVRVIYSESHQQEEADLVVGRIATVFGELEEAVGSIEKFGTDASRIRRRITSALLAEVVRLQAHFKSSAFEEEKEWRLVQFVHPGAANPKIQFRTSSAGIVPYVELALQADPHSSSHSLPIESLIFGPTLDPNFTEDVLRLLVGKRGFSSVKVAKSAVPFRA